MYSVVLTRLLFLKALNIYTKSQHIIPKIKYYNKIKDVKILQTKVSPLNVRCYKKVNCIMAKNAEECEENAVTSWNCPHAQTWLKVNLFVDISNCIFFHFSLAVLQMRNFAGTTKVISPLKHSQYTLSGAQLLVSNMQLFALSLVDIIC